MGIETFIHFRDELRHPIDFNTTPSGFNTRNTGKRGKSFHYKGYINGLKSKESEGGKNVRAQGFWFLLQG